MFITTIAQTLGAEALFKYINPSEAIKRLAASQGIDILNLVKTEQQLQQDLQKKQQRMQQQSLIDQAGQLASSPAMDPQKTDKADERIDQISQAIQPPQQ